MDICGCCNSLAVKEIFPAYEFMNTDSLEVAGIPLSVIPERHIVLDPVSGEFVCNRHKCETKQRKKNIQKRAEIGRAHV